jgi:hypothetical protein
MSGRHAHVKAEMVREPATRAAAAAPKKVAVAMDVSATPATNRMPHRKSVRKLAMHIAVHMRVLVAQIPAASTVTVPCTSKSW